MKTFPLAALATVSLLFACSAQSAPQPEKTARSSAAMEQPKAMPAPAADPVADEMVAQLDEDWEEDELAPAEEDEAPAMAGTALELDDRELDDEEPEMVDDDEDWEDEDVEEDEDDDEDVEEVD